MRLAASQSPKDDGKLTELAAEVQRAAAKEKETKAEMIILQVSVLWRAIINKGRHKKKSIFFRKKS